LERTGPEAIEFMGAFWAGLPDTGCGDCVERSMGFSKTPFGAEERVPSEVWILRVAGGRPEGGGCFFDLNRKDMVDRLLTEKDGEIQSR
jgi:hypothetical protein